jgi:hypothetical protein
LKRRRAGALSKGSQNRLSVLASSFATMTVNPSWSVATRIICSWRCSKRIGRRVVKNRCASNCRHFDPLLMPPVQWRRSPPGWAPGEVTPGEAVELSKLVEAYIKALEAGEFDQRLRAVEARNHATRP